MYALANRTFITPAFIISDINTAGRTGTRIDMRDHAHATFICYTQDVAAAVTFTFNRQTAVSGGTTEVLDVIDHYWQKSGTAETSMIAVDNLTLITQAVSEVVNTVSGSANLTVVEIDAEQLTHRASTNSLSQQFRWISVDAAATGAACMCCGIWILSGSRYMQEPIAVTVP